jgi:hypothetical protein
MHRALIEAGVNVNRADNDGKTALCWLPRLDEFLTSYPGIPAHVPHLDSHSHEPRSDSAKRARQTGPRRSDQKRQKDSQLLDKSSAGSSATHEQLHIAVRGEVVQDEIPTEHDDNQSRQLLRGRASKHKPKKNP